MLCVSTNTSLCQWRIARSLSILYCRDYAWNHMCPVLLLYEQNLLCTKVCSARIETSTCMHCRLIGPKEILHPHYMYSQHFLAGPGLTSAVNAQASSPVVPTTVSPLPANTTAQTWCTAAEPSRISPKWNTSDDNMKTWLENIQKKSLYSLTCALIGRCS
jgi:hypothetical protein